MSKNPKQARRSDKPGQEPGRADCDRILARVVSELPARRGSRRARWRMRDLELILELASAARATLTEAAPANQQHDRIFELGRIAETAQRLIAARRPQHHDRRVGGAELAQVAYLVPLEVVVDLEQQAVTKVVVIDEAIELDVDEGARTASTLAPLPPDVAQTAVRLAELQDGGAWPAMQFGW